MTQIRMMLSMRALMAAPEAASELVSLLSAQHASERHGDQLTWAIRESCQADPKLTMQRADGRKAIGCWFHKNGEDRLGVTIEEADGEFWITINARAKYLYWGPTLKAMALLALNDKVSLGLSGGFHYILNRNFESDPSLSYIGVLAQLKL